jgi:primosomal protein N' (replication factor Y)
LGPIEAPLPKIAEHYRWQMLLKGSPAKTLHWFVERLVAENPSLFGQRPVKVIVDVDPHFMM